MLTRPFRLRFADADLEARFRAFHRQRAIVAARRMMLLGIVLFGGFVLLDALLAPEALRITIPLRLAGCAILGSAFAATFWRRGGTMLGRTLFLVAVVYVVLVIEYLIWTLPPHQAVYYLPGVPTVQIFLLAAPSFTLAELLGLSAFIALSYAALAPLLPVEILPMYLAVGLYLLAFVTIGLVAGYGNERAVRRDFLANLTLSNERNLSRELAERERAASQAKSNFLAHMSHELRTPLNAILAYSEIIRDAQIGSDDPDRYRRYAGDIHTSGTHLLRLIEDLLDMARVEAGKYQLHEEDVPAEQLMEDALSVVQPLIDRKGLLVTLVGPGSPLFLRVDPRAMIQVLVNVLSNSIKFTPESGRIDCRVAVEGDGVRMVVRDTGIGMPPEKIPDALEPFGQIENPAHASTGGTGLGLTIVQALMELHGGRVEIASALGSGTTVTLTLPSSRIVQAPSLG